MPVLSPIASNSAAAAVGCWSGELDAAGGAEQEGGRRLAARATVAGNHCIHCGWNWKTTSRSVMCSPSPTSLIQSWGRFEPTRTRCPAREAADVVSDDGPAGPVLDQVDLELGMVVPAAVRAGVVVHVPAGRGAGHGRHQLAGGRFSDQSTGSRDRAQRWILAASLILFSLIIRGKRMHGAKKYQNRPSRPLEADVRRAYAFRSVARPAQPLRKRRRRPILLNPSAVVFGALSGRFCGDYAAESTSLALA